MPSPISPSELEYNLPSIDKSACEKLMDAFFGFPTALSEWFCYSFDSNGNLSDAFIEDICVSGAIRVTTTTTTAP